MITGRPEPDGAASVNGSKWWVTGLAIVLLCGAVLAAFWPTLGNQFLNWDDDRNFTENLAFRDWGMSLLRWAWSTYHLGVWQPLSWCLLSGQYAIGALDPAVYHAVGLLLHALNAVVLYFLVIAFLRRTETQRGRESRSALPLAAAVATLLFAIHPLRVEAVTWVSCQPYLPAVLFYMLGVLCHLRGQGSELGSNRRRWPWWLLTFTFYLLAVMSKAAAVTLPAILLLVDVYPLRRFSRRPAGRGREVGVALVEKLPFFAVAAMVSVWAAEAKDFSETRVPFALAAMPARVAQSVYALNFYLYKTVLPRNLIPYYELPADLDPWTWFYAACAATVVGLTVALILLRRRWPGVITAWLAYILILLPNLGLVQIGQQIAADRYSYLAMMPLTVLLAAGLLRLFRRVLAIPQAHAPDQGGRRAPDSSREHADRRGLPWGRLAGLLAIMAAIVVALTAASRRQTRIWHDSISLWEATLAVDPNCAVAECNLATALVYEGRYREGSLHLSRAIDLKPWFGFAYANFGVLLLEDHQPQDAVIALEHALEYGSDLGPLDQAKVHAALGEAYSALRQYDLAWKHARAAQHLGFMKADRLIEYLRQISMEPVN
jgi:tetratricopeptide (TPR) repeat protein